MLDMFRGTLLPPARITGALILIVALGCTAFPAFAQKKDGAEAVLAAFGDSLMAGFGLPPGEGFAPKLKSALEDAGHNVAVIDAAQSGDTSKSGRERLAWTLEGNPGLTHAIVGFGGNDMLRGIEPAETEANLEAIILALKARNIEVLLAGMLAQRNLGPEYAEAFDGIYPKLAEKHDVALYPFFLDGVATVRDLNLPDGIHPNEKGVEVIVGKILPHVVRLIGSSEAAASGE